MKKIIGCLLLFALILSSLTACGRFAPEESDNETSVSTEHTENTPIWTLLNEDKYKIVLDMYKDIIMNLDKQWTSEDCPYSEGTPEYDRWTAVLGAVQSFHLSTNVPGYAFCDLNQNGNDEMLLLLDDYTVLAIFSFVDNQPILLDNYWNRKRCTIDEDGTLQIYGSGGADTSSFSIFKISDDDKELVLLEEYGTDGYDTDTLHPYYYKISDGTKTSITVLEYAAARSQGVYSSIEDLAKHTKENAKFEFIPLGLWISYYRIFERILNYDTKITSENKYLWQLYFSFGNGSIANLNSIETCYLDMDGDGVVELLLRSDIKDHLVLRYYEGAVYLYEFSYKEMAKVYEDGSYSWSSPTYLEDYSHHYGISKLTFNESTINPKSIYTIYDGENESYFTINRKLASKNELDALVESRKNIKEVTWRTYSLDSDKIHAKG